MSLNLSLADFEKAAMALKNVAVNTRLDYSRTFSEMSNAQVFLKLENTQKTGSFKLRGAYNKIHSLTEEEKSKGVIASSAGNHAQGVAYAAAKAGIKSTIVMPEMAPLAKIMATKGYGAEVVLSGSVYDEAYKAACEIQRSTGATFIHPFNDPLVIAGQGTIALEILQAEPDVEAIVVPIGGGGIIAGIAMAAKMLSPNIKVYGVQAKGAAAMQKSFYAHRLETTDTAVTIADGIAVKIPGDATFKIIENYVDDVVLVSDEEIANGIFLMMERAKQIVEGAGATAVAAVLGNKLRIGNKKVAAVVSGGNVDWSFVCRVIEKGLLFNGRIVNIVTEVIDKPGNLHKLLAIVADLQANIINLNQYRLEQKLPFGYAFVELNLETKNKEHIEEIISALNKAGYKARIETLQV